jgi:predicted nuclease with TOPRIM domain|nr:MAG TPA: hypothetical protein [Caudoviricetes sp.]
MSKELNSAKKRISALEEENKKLKSQMNDLDSRVKKNTRDIESLRETNIINALQERNIPGNPNSKPRFTYDEIANMYGTNAANVCRIAKDNNISRRVKKMS